MRAKENRPALRGGGAMVPSTGSIRLVSESLLFEEIALPPFVRLGLALVCLFVVAFLVWASITSIDETAETSGVILPSSDNQLVESLDGGKVAQILVNESDHVAKGQVLARMDPTQPLADLAQLQSHEVDLQLRAERLKAEAAGRAPNFEAIGAAYPDKIAAQQSLWDSQVAANKSALAVLDDQIAQRQHETALVQGQLASARQELAIATNQVGILRQGVQATVVSRENYLESSRDVIAGQGQVNVLARQVEIDQGALAEAEGNRRNLVQTQLQGELAELGSIGDDMSQTRQQIARAQNVIDRLDIRAPMEGVVQDLRYHAPGEVVPAGGQLMTVVPEREVLYAQVRISPADIGVVAVKQRVKIKVASYDYTRYGTVNASVSKISPSTLTDAQGHAYYEAEIAIPSPYVQDNRQEGLLPGMTLDADIITGHKTLMEYLLKPVFVSLADSGSKL